MADNPPHLLHHRWQFTFILILGLILAGVVSGCGAIDQLRATATPTATATYTPTPTTTPTPTPTPTPTIIPPPQGEWSQYWDSNQMYELLIDGKGFLWGRGLGTIIRWDLREGTYQEFGIAQGLPKNTADQIFLGPSGEVWLYFQDQPLFQFDGQEWISHLEEGQIPGYQLDATALGSNGTLWICTDEGFSRYDGKEWSLYNVTEGMLDGKCEYITVDKHGNLWMQGVEGLSIFDDPDWIGWTIEGVDFEFGDPQGAYTAPNGTVWFAYGGEGLLWYDGTYWQMENTPPKDFALTSTGKAWMIDDWGNTQPNNLVEFKYGIHPKDVFYSGSNPVLIQGWYWNWSFSGEMPVDRIEAMYPGVNNDLWLTYKEGLIHVAQGKMELVPLEGMTSATDIKDFEISRTGQIYLAFKEGIYKLSGDQTQPLMTESGLIGINITGMAVDTNGTLWLDANQGLQSYDGDIWSKPNLPGDNISDLVQGPGGEIWITHYPYLSRWDGTSLEIFNSKELDDLPTKYINDIFVDEDGVLWLGYSSGDIISYDGTDWNSYPMDEDTDLGSLRNIARDRSGIIYLVTLSSGTYYLNWQDDQGWESLELEHSAAAFSRHPNGELWLLLTSGEMFVLEDGKMEAVELENPAPEATIYDLVFGTDGSIWLASSQGAFRYDNLGWESYTAADGLREDRVFTIATAPDGTVWFAGSGLTRLGPP